jgi:hypothetical protein
MKPITLVIGVIVLLSSVAPSQNVTARPTEQRSFEIGHHRPVVKHPISLSDADLVALRKATPVEQKIPGLEPEELTPSIPRATRDGLEAAVIHLNGPAERDLIVTGSGRRYISGQAPYWTVAPFWVIREERDGPQVILAILTRGLEIGRFNHQGLADLEAWRDTGMGGLRTFLQFNGDKYIEMGYNMD